MRIETIEWKIKERVEKTQFEALQFAYTDGDITEIALN